MFSTIKRAIGTVTLALYNGEYHIEGIPAQRIAADITKMWGSSRIFNSMFNLDRAGNSELIFNEFFLIDVYYAFNKLLTSKHTRATRSVNKVIRILEQETWLKDLKAKDVPSRLDYSGLSDFNYSPLDYQTRVFEEYEDAHYRYNLQGGFLQAAAGSGKTILSLMLMNLLRKKHIFIITPNNALNTVWRDTLDGQFRTKQNYWISDSNLPVTDQYKYYVCHYEYLSKFYEMVKTLKLSNVGIILDESHNFNTRDTLRTTTFVALCKLFDSEDVLWMSGTSIKALATETIPLFRTITKTFTEDTENRFKKVFGVSSERATDIIANRLGLISLVVEKKEIKVNKPIFQEVKVKVPDSDKFTLNSISQQMAKFTEDRGRYYAERQKDDYKVYFECLTYFEKHASRQDKLGLDKYHTDVRRIRQMNGDARFCAEEMKAANAYERNVILPVLPKELVNPFKEVKTIYKYIKLKIQGECLGRVIGRARIDAHVEMAKHIDYASILEFGLKKTVIFSSFTEVLKVAQDQIDSEGYSSLGVYGDTTNQLAQRVKRFETDESVNPLTTTYKSLSTAVPLITADKVLMIDAPFRDYILQQTVSRISRLGQDSQTYAFTATLDTGNELNISTRSVDILKWSQTQIAAITGISSPYDLNEDILNNNISLEDYFDRPTAISLEDNSPGFMKW